MSKETKIGLLISVPIYFGWLGIVALNDGIEHALSALACSSILLILMFSFAGAMSSIGK